MRILFFSDWRIQPMEWIDRMLDEAGDVDFVVYGGDDTLRFAPRVDWPREVFEKADQLARRKRKLTTAVAAMTTILGREPVVVPEAKESTWVGQWHTLSPGQILRYFASPEGSYFQRLGERSRHGVGAVIGNDCMPEDRAVLGGTGVFNLHAQPAKVGAWGFVGIEGNIVSTNSDGGYVNDVGLIPHQDSEVLDLLERGMRQLKVDESHLVVLSHTPPHGLLDLAIRFGVSHLGSPALEKFVRERAPAMVLCGHAHSQGGRSVRIGKTLVVNAASSDNRAKEARGALIELVEGALPELRWIEPARHSTTVVSGVGPVAESKLAAIGVKTADALYSAPIRDLIQAGIPPATAARFSAKGRAFRAGVPVWLESRHQPVPYDVVLYDVETGLAPGRFDPLRFDTAGAAREEAGQEPWLIAAGTGTVGDEVLQWESLGEDRVSRRRMLEDFLDFVEANGNTTCAWSGTGFDDRAIVSGLRRWYPRGLVRWERIRKLDLCAMMKQTIELPGSWSIKDVARFLGWQGPEDEWDGFQAGLAYEAYRQLGESFDVEGVKRYNRLDIEQLAFTYHWYATAVKSEAALRFDTTNAPRARWTAEGLAALEAQLAQGLSAYEIELPGYTTLQVRRKIAYLRSRERG